jgi:hypothetical protein
MSLSRRYTPSAPQLPSVVAELGYLKPGSERPYNYMYEPPYGAPWQNCQYDVRATCIKDARSLTTRLSVHREGFELWDAPSAVTDSSTKPPSSTSTAKRRPNSRWPSQGEAGV